MAVDRDRLAGSLARAALALAAIATFAADTLHVAAEHPPGTTPAVRAARDHRQAHTPRILAEFAELLVIPNVASDLPNVTKNAEWIRDAFARRGVELELLTLPGVPPIVTGRLDVPGAKRTLGIYVHYDGQPVDVASWTTPPWEPTLFDGAISDGAERIAFPEPGNAVDAEWRLYARGSGDDRAPLIVLLAALDALHAGEIAPTSNLVFLFEGEEEAGSPHLGRYFEAHRDRLRADLWLICDGPVHQSRRPQIVFGVRGITQLELTVYGPIAALHSGHYGNWAPNPGMELARLLASTKDADGRVLVEGFYDTAVPLGEPERRALEAMPDVDASLRREFAIGRSEGADRLEHSLLRPSLNVRGLASATVGETARNIVPATATAAIDIRLVKGNDPDRMKDLVEAHVRRQGWHVVRETPDRATRLAHERVVRIRRGAGYRAARTAMDSLIVHPILVAADRVSVAMTGQPVLRVPTLGGSLPVYLFEEKLEAPFLIVPIANHDNNQHAPDENIRIANLWYGIDLMAAILTAESGFGERSPSKIE